jgi:8-oxo-dGTP diphosphatase
MDAGAASWIEVAAAVVERADGTFLLAQRPQGKVYAGWWEFPGGKCEPGEAPMAALARELHEELGITVRQAVPWITRTHVYEHGRVRLHFFRVLRWDGEPQSRESQAFAWQRLLQLTVSPVLPANGPILKALALPVFMGITQASQLGEAAFLGRLEAALEAGLRLVQVREHGMAGDRLEAFARAVVQRAHRAGALVMINGSADLAHRAGADGLHLTAGSLRSAQGRPAFEWVGASCHDRLELELAQRLGCDYALAGPVLATASHPGVEGAGFDALAQWVSLLELPVLAIGGLGPGHLEQARLCGAHGVAAIRLAWV